MIRPFRIACVSLCFALGLMICGCDEPEIDPANYGKLLDNLSEVEEAKEHIPVPEIEGIDPQLLPRIK